MEKKESIIMLGIKLLIISAVAGLLLGAVYSITKGPIKAQTEMANTSAMKQLITNATEFKIKDGIDTTGTGIIEINEGFAGGKSVGYAVKTSVKGYGGKLEMMVGLSTDGKVLGIQILSLNETPGLGANATKPAFYEQYKNKSTDKPLEVVKTAPTADNQIQAITGATKTSSAITTGVNEIVNTFNNLKGGNK